MAIFSLIGAGIRRSLNAESSKSWITSLTYPGLEGVLKGGWANGDQLKTEYAPNSHLIRIDAPTQIMVMCGQFHQIRWDKPKVKRCMTIQMQPLRQHTRSLR